MTSNFKTSRFTLLPIACFLSVLTYAGVLPDSIVAYLPYVIWMTVFIESLLYLAQNKSFRVGKNQFVFGCLVGAFFLILSVLSIFFAKDYFKSSIVYALAIDLAVLFCGVILGNKLTQNDVFVCCNWYVVGVIILAIYIFATNINTGFNLDSSVYLAFNKNSVGQILSTAVLIILLTGKKYKNKSVIVRFVISLFLIAMMFLIRSRASLLCFAIAIVLVLTSKYANRKVKKTIIIVLVVALIYLAINSELRDELINKIIFANRDTSSLDSISSGRITRYQSFLQLFKENYFEGYGATYLECFYLSTLLQFGLVGGMLLNFIVVYVNSTIKKYYEKVNYGALLLIISLSYSINGIFEGLAPLGPGTKNFMLWLIFGFMCSQTHIREVEKN